MKFKLGFSLMQKIGIRKKKGRQLLPRGKSNRVHLLNLLLMSRYDLAWFVLLVWYAGMSSMWYNFHV